jgi:hypothetical protein
VEGLVEGAAILDQRRVSVRGGVFDNPAMRGSISMAELGLALIFISRSVTRIYQRRAISRYGIAGVRAAQTPGTGVIPLWVSLVAVIGWSTAVVAGALILLL